MASKSGGASKSAGVAAEAAAHMTTTEAAMASAKAAVASTRRGMSSTALRADRHYRDYEEERREGNQATHCNIIRHFRQRKT